MRLSFGLDICGPHFLLHFKRGANQIPRRSHSPLQRNWYIVSGKKYLLGIVLSGFQGSEELPRDNTYHAVTQSQLILAAQTHLTGHRPTNVTFRFGLDRSTLSK
jgi:hypothetical protein